MECTNHLIVVTFVKSNHVNRTIMKHLLFIISFILSSVQVYGQFGYYYKSKFISLIPDCSLYYIQTQTSEQMSQIKESLSRGNDSIRCISTLSSIGCLFTSIPEILPKECYYSNIYYSENDFKIAILPRLAIKLKIGHSIDEVLVLHKDVLKLDIEKSGIFIFDCNLNTSEDVLKLNELIYQMDATEWCEPMMISNIKKFISLYPSQYYLHNTGQNGGTPGVDINVEPAWSIVSANENIIVAVIDEGVERNHENLSGNVLDGLTIDHPDEKGDPINDYWLGSYYESKSHGTACAGIIAAKDNFVGIKGVAYGVKILPINVFPQDEDDYIYSYSEKVGNAIRWAYNTKGADIISCSMGFPNCQYISSAFEDAINYGRGGKGTIVVCASGNSIPYSNVFFPANMTGTIAVGAINKSGNIWDYSCRGSSLDLVAPSGATNYQGDIVTTDRSTPKGVNPTGNYMDCFGGTSAACPQVAGVAALILSLRPDLTGSEVRNVLCTTARDLGNPGRDDTFGYGLVDAYAALNSINYSISGKTVLCDTANYVIIGLSSGFTINWSIDNNNFSISPSGYQCLVTYTGTPQYSVAYLTATVSWSGTTIKTLTKRIVMHGTDLSVIGWQNSGPANPNGTYPEIDFTIPNNRTLPSGYKLERPDMEDLTDKESLPIVFRDDIAPVEPDTLIDLCGYGVTDIYGGNKVYLSSNRLDGMDISFSGPVFPTYFHRSNTSGNVTFNIPYQANIYYTTLHAQSEGHCHDFCLTFRVNPLPGSASGDDDIWVEFTGSMLYITYMVVGVLGNNGQYYFPSYSLTISKIPAGTQVYSGVFPGDQGTVAVNTSTWTSGIYSIRIVCNGHTYTKTIYL